MIPYVATVPLVAIAMALGATPVFATEAVSPAVVPANRTTTLEASLVLGTPVERAVPSRAYGLAIAKDQEEKWLEASTLYQQAIAEWSGEHRIHPSPALERAIQKAERERQRSQMLANLQPVRPDQPAAVNRAFNLEQARLHRTKLMVVRAYTGTVPQRLYARTRDEFGVALRMTDVNKPAAQGEVQLFLCATHAAAGKITSARLALAHVSRTQREDPANALAMGICAAALGDLPRALAHLEAHILRQGGDQRMDPFSLRDLFLANDWDRLRGNPRFESLFARQGRY